jgi:hypothetical protein
MRKFFLIISIALGVTPAFAQERQWSLDASGPEAYLVFGVADTDDVGLSFWCKIGSGKISIFTAFNRDLIGKDQTAKARLKVDDQVFDIKMLASTGLGSKTGSLEGPVSVTGTVMKAVQHASQFSITAFGHTMSYPMIDADVGGLLATCSGEVGN